MADDTFTSPGAQAPRRALVVDDDEAIRRLVCRVLKTEGIEVDEAGDGDAALRRARTAAYDVILLDLHLPTIDGDAVLLRLRARYPGQVVIMFSCQSDPATRRRCLRAGASDFLAKPFSLHELLESISTACTGARQIA